MQITHVEAIPYSLPYRRPVRFASGVIERADNVLVRVQADDGTVGQAEAQPRPYTYGETQASIVAAVSGWLSRALAGVDPLDTELAGARCADLAGNNVARGAVDLAVCDLAGQILGRSCHAMLGGHAQDVAAAHMVSFAEPAEMAGEARELNGRHGIAAFKIKVGREVALDVAACAAIREALPEADLYVDANRGWSYEQALVAGDGLLGLGVRAIEEPIALDDRVGRRRLAERWPVPIVGDESCIGLAETTRALDEGAVGMVSIKTARTGFSESRRILDLCRDRGVPVLVGSQYEGGAGALASAAFASAFTDTARRPAELTNVLDLADDLVVAPMEIRDGRVAPPDTPGTGVEIDEDKLAHYRLDRHRLSVSA